MKDLEPAIYRQRLIMEGHYGIEAVEETIRTYLTELSKVCEMQVFAGPFAWPPDERSHPEVKLHDLNGFVAWTESGCHVYAWPSYRFFTVDVYICKPLDSKKVVAFTREFFKSEDIVDRLI